MLSAKVAINETEKITLICSKEGTEILANEKSPFVDDIVDYALPLIRLEKQVNSLSDMCLHKKFTEAMEVLEGLTLETHKLHYYLSQTIKKEREDALSAIR